MISAMGAVCFHVDKNVCACSLALPLFVSEPSVFSALHVNLANLPTFRLG
jgi:hypothetical protein